MAIAAFTPRRAYAVAGIIALFVIPNIVAGIVVGLGSYDIGSWLTLLSPTSVLDGTNASCSTCRGIRFDDVIIFLEPWAYFAAAAVGIAGRSR